MALKPASYAGKVKPVQPYPPTALALAGTVPPEMAMRALACASHAAAHGAAGPATEKREGDEESMMVVRMAFEAASAVRSRSGSVVPAPAGTASAATRHVKADDAGNPCACPAAAPGRGQHSPTPTVPCCCPPSSTPPRARRDDRVLLARRDRVYEGAVARPVVSQLEGSRGVAV